MSFGFSKKKQSQSQESSNKVEPWAYSEDALKRITDQAGVEYDENLNNKYLGGYDINNVFADYTNRQKDIMDMGANAYGMVDPSKFTDSTAYLNQIMQGNDNTLAGINQRNFASGVGSDFMNDQVAGKGRNAYNELGSSSEEFVKDLGRRVTDQITNQTAMNFNKYGMFDPNSANFQRTVGEGVSNEIADDLLQYYSADRGLQFDAINNEITNQYNAGATQQDNMYNAGNQMQSNQFNIASQMPDYLNNQYQMYNSALNNSLGFDQYGVDYQNALNQLGIGEAQFNQDNDMAALGDYYNMIMGISSGFPSTFSTGSSRGKSSGFGGSFSFV
ncbi:MAG: hypothetical protein CMB64_01535 [Euryarchaeota archaeon]|nr:hypothetical protein [Euryarchaeota archaeon]